MARKRVVVTMAGRNPKTGEFRTVTKVKPRKSKATSQTSRREQK